MEPPGCSGDAGCYVVTQEKVSLEEGMATHSSTTSWRISTNSLMGYSSQGLKESDTIEVTEYTCTHYTACDNMDESGGHNDK